MSSIRMRFHLPNVDGQAIAELIPVSSPSSHVRSVSSIAIPATSDPSRWSRPVDVSTGTYLVRARLPSGVRAEQTVNVTGPGTVNVELARDDSPHEWLAWTRYAGRVESRRRYERLTALPAFTRPNLDELRAVAWRRATSAVESLDWDMWERSPVERLRDLASQALPIPTAPYGRDSQSRTFLVGDGRPSSSDPGVAYALVELGDAAWLAVLPIGWESETSGRPLAAHLTVRSPVGDEAARVSTHVEDERIGPILEFAASGDLGAVRTLLDEAVELLYGKVRNPFAAAAGAYLLVLTGGREPRAPWFHWVTNLENWFPWLADGAIAAGWLAIEQARPEDAERHFALAVRRGLPLYSLGMRLLVDGLTMLENETPLARSLLRSVTPASRAVDRTQPFCVLRVTRRANR